MTLEIAAFIAFGLFWALTLTSIALMGLASNQQMENALNSHLRKNMEADIRQLRARVSALESSRAILEAENRDLRRQVDYASTIGKRVGAG